MATTRYTSRAKFTLPQRLDGLIQLQLNFLRPVRKLLSKEEASTPPLGNTYF